MIVNVHDAKTNLSKLLARVERGEEIVIGRAGAPIARLVPFEGQSVRSPGALRGQVQIADDFDEPLLELEALVHDTPLDR